MGILGQFQPSSPTLQPCVLLGPRRQKGAVSEKPSDPPSPFLGEGEPLRAPLVCGVTLQCRTVLAPVPKCGLKGLEVGQELAPGPTHEDWY